MRRSVPVRGERGFTLAETLICMAVAAALIASPVLLVREPTSAYIARQDMDRLERWLANAIARADRWKRNFYLSVHLPQGSASKHYMVLSWLDDAQGRSEEFYAADGIRWSLNGTAQDMTYRWQTHAVSPAFTLSACDADGTLTGETLTVSVRALLTRGHAE